MAATPTAYSLPDFDLPPPRAAVVTRLARWGVVALLHGALLQAVVSPALPQDAPRAARTVSVRLLPVRQEQRSEPAPVAKAAPVAKRPQPARPRPILAARSVDAPAPFAVAPQPAAPVPQAAPAAEAPVVTAARFDVDYLHNPKPVYPPFSRRAGEEGRVLLRVRVSPEGAALAVEVEQSSGFARLDKAALEAVQKWRFIPARRGNEILETSVTVPLTFRIE